MDKLHRIAGMELEMFEGLDFDAFDPEKNGSLLRGRAMTDDMRELKFLQLQQQINKRRMDKEAMLPHERSTGANRKQSFRQLLKKTIMVNFLIILGYHFAPKGFIEWSHRLFNMLLGRTDSEAVVEYEWD